MFDRQDILEEQLLRENIRKAIRIIKNKRLNEEKSVRGIIQSLLNEVKFEFTALNRLKHLINNVIWNNDDSDTAFKEAYTDIASGREDRDEFVKWIMHFSNIEFDTVDAIVDPSEIEPESEETSPEEQITVSLDDLEKRGGDVTFDPELEEEDELIGEDTPEKDDEESEGIKKLAEEAYDLINTQLEKSYGGVPKEFLKKPVEVDGVTYPPGEKTERWLYRVYYEKNLMLAAARYEDMYFDESPDTDIQIAPDEETFPEEEEEFDLGF